MNSHLLPFRINEKDEWCFTLKDFSESVRNDPELITRIEATLPRKYGIFVSCIDSEKKMICLTSDEEHTAGKLLRILKNFGLKAKFQKTTESA